MKKNVRVLQINGIRGLLLTLFIVSCLIAGFGAFPGLIAMHLWNYIAIKTGSFATINLGAGVLLWGIIALSAFIINKRKLIISFNSPQELTDDEVRAVISKIKKQSANMTFPAEFVKSADLNKKTENSNENIETKTETNES